MLEEEIIEATEKWMDELGATMDRMVRRAGDGESFDTDLYRRLAALDGLVVSLAAYASASKDCEVEAASNRRNAL